VADAIADPVGDARLQNAKTRVVPLLPPASYHVAPIEHGQQANDFLGIVLKISVDGGDHLPAGGFEAGVEGGALSAIAGHAEHAQEGVTPQSFPQQRRRGIAAAIVTYNDLEIPAHPAQRRRNVLKQGRDRLLFVVDGNDKR